MTTNIYILKLEDNCYYIGKSENVEQRFQQHLSGSGSSFTKKHKPILIEKVFNNVSPFDEDKYVKEYMSKYGIDKVRGGTYVNEILDDNQIFNLKKEIWGAKDLCTKCGRNTHWIANCHESTDVDGCDLIKYNNNFIKDCPLEFKCKYCPRKFLSLSSAESHEKCCDKNNNLSMWQWMSNIVTELPTVTQRLSDEIDNAKDTTIYYCKKCNKEFEDNKKCYMHEKYCKIKNTKIEQNKNVLNTQLSFNKTKIELNNTLSKYEEQSAKDAKLLMSNTKKKNKCNRCGRENHTTNNCYATTDVDGFDIEEDIIIYSCEKCNKEFEDEKKCEIHEKYCKIKNVKKQTTKKNSCYRCGRDNHYANNCYASTNINGHELESDSDSDY